MRASRTPRRPTGEARFGGGWIGYLGFADLMRNDLSRACELVMHT
jgi:hypothetical protein